MEAFLQFNWLDVIILVVVLFYAFEGFETGFVSSLLDVLSFAASFMLGLRFYAAVAGLLVQYTGVPIGFASAGGFFAVALVSEILIGFLLRKVVGSYYNNFVSSVEDTMQKTHSISFSSTTFISLNKVLGIIPGALSACIILSFLLTVIIALPFSSFLKQSISVSRFGNTLIAGGQVFEGTLNKVFGQTIADTLNFLTVKPASDEVVVLNFKTTAVKENIQAEQEMVELINKEREKEGLKPVVFDNNLQVVARIHSKDMFARGYFSHNTPDGVSPFDRLSNAGIDFTAAGENLALAPNAAIAMQGLMQSPGHRANILSSSFGKVGIGAIDGGMYGIMFSQEFTD